MSGIAFNEDNGAPLGTIPRDEASVDDLIGWLEPYGGSQTREMILCINAQRSNVRSAVLQTLWDGYDPDADNSQPFFAGIEDNYRGGGAGHVEGYRNWIHRLWSLDHRGIDPYQHWIARCRELGLSPWISMRMNDVHYTDLPDHPLHDRMWREHPEWRVAPWRGDNLTDRSLDYAQSEVYAHHLAYAREMLARYDIDGLELDWLRSCYNLRPGHEVTDSPVLTRFHAQVREALYARERQVGHRIKLGVRVPCHPESARRLGMDVVTWARRDLIDLLCVAPHLITYTDPPIELWRALLEGTGVLLAPTMFREVRAAEGLGYHRHSLETARGTAASWLDRGVDRVYLFNTFYSPAWDPVQKERYRRLVSEIGSLETMTGKSRRHVLTYCDQWATGEAKASALPRKCAHDYGEEFRLPLGPDMLPGQRAEVRIAAQVGGEPVVPRCSVRLNGALCSPAGEISMPAGFQKGATYWDAPEEGLRPYRMQGYAVPEAALHRGDNVVEVRNREERPITLIWVEVAVSDTGGNISQNPVDSESLP